MKCGHCKASGVDIAHVRGHLARVVTAELAEDARAVVAGPATEGMYRKNGEVYKVVTAVHGSGRLYAKRLDRDVMMYVMAPGALSRLSQADRMTVEEAAAFGKVTGVCVRCAAVLTDEASIERGMGPVCATKI